MYPLRQFLDGLVAAELCAARQVVTAAAEVLARERLFGVHLGPSRVHGTDAPLVVENGRGLTKGIQEHFC